MSFVYVARLSLFLHFESLMLFSLFFISLFLEHSAALAVSPVVAEEEEEEVREGGHSF